jgi:predicted nucleic acid-binding protein
MVLVDSSVWIEALRRDGNVHVKLALEALLEAYEATWCGPVKLEVLGGARAQERKALEEQFSCIPYLPMRDAEWEAAKNLAWRLRDKGCTVPWNDILIATLARHAECRLYSVDKHFNLMYENGAGIVLYEPGYGGKYEPN